jgi:hypothetical protein
LDVRKLDVAAKAQQQRIERMFGFYRADATMLNPDTMLLYPCVFWRRLWYVEL